MTGAGVGGYVNSEKADPGEDERRNGNLPLSAGRSGAPDSARADGNATDKYLEVRDYLSR